MRFPPRSEDLLFVVAIMVGNISTESGFTSLSKTRDEDCWTHFGFLQQTERKYTHVIDVCSWMVAKD